MSFLSRSAVGIRAALHSSCTPQTLFGGALPRASNSSTLQFGSVSRFASTTGSRQIPKATKNIALTVPGTKHGSSTASSSWWTGASLVAGVGLMATTWPRRKTILCDASSAFNKAAASNASPFGPEAGSPGGPPPQSVANIYQLSFGTICGLCAGIFIKKGAKLIAFFLGGTYILLQYFSSQRLVSVNWNSISRRWDSLVDRAAGPADSVSGGGIRSSPLVRIWDRFVHFLSADFQPRATFVAGLVLGLRIG